MQFTKALTVTALLLALASIIVTRVLKAFSVAEVLAVLACLAGIGIIVAQRQAAEPTALKWPQRLIVIGAAIGLGGVILKLAFVLLGIGVAPHDMANHDSGLSPRVLEHIHHLFFNIGFLFMAAAAILLLIGMFRKARGAR